MGRIALFPRKPDPSLGVRGSSEAGTSELAGIFATLTLFTFESKRYIISLSI